MAGDLSKRAKERLDELVDEETNRKFGELNIVTDVSESSDGEILVEFTPFSPYSPTAVGTGRMIKTTCLLLEGVKGVKVECNGHMMDDLINRLVNKDAKSA